MTTLIKRKVAILSLLLAATLMSRAQEGSLVFKYMEHGVKTICSAEVALPPRNTTNEQ